METTWTLRQGVKWHDGKELTADDVRFGWEVNAEPAIPLGARSPARLIDRVETPDPYTIVFHWRTSSPLGAELTERELDVPPRHVLGAAFAADPASLLNHPYLQTVDAFIGAGPYRPVDRVLGSHLTVEAFSDYFLGKPKIDRVTFKFFDDPRTVLTNLLSGTLELSYRAIGMEEARVLQQEWRNGGGTVHLRPDNLRHLLPQLRADWAKPIDLLDLSVRKALYHGMNREQIVEALGLSPELIADSIALPGTDIGEAVSRQVVRYPNDPPRAATLLQEAGWQRGGDGLLRKNEQPFRLEFRGSQDTAQEFAVIQQQYRGLGIDLVFQPASLVRAEIVEFPGVVSLGLPANSLNFANRWHSRQIAGPENRYAGNNVHGYRNPATNEAIERLERSLRREDQLRSWGEAWRIITEDVAVIPMYFATTPLAVRTGLVGVVPQSPLGNAAYQVHLWESSP
jgi:peptide/nickel transport system substrate-binding protein